jgi:hypothetical protein
MPQTTAQKLRIKEGDRLLTFHAPGDFASSLAPLPAGVSISAHAQQFEQIHWFVKDKAQMEKELDKVISLVHDSIICWIYYPKGSSGLQTDLTRDKGWEKLLAKDMQWISLVSFNDIWSVFGMRQKTAADVQKKAVPRQQQFADYIDAKTKTVRVPDDLQKELSKHKALKEVFEKLAFSHRREYVEWIVSAKKEETRANRVAGTIERLQKGQKIPAGR